MSTLSRKAFLKLSAAAVVSTAVGGKILAPGKSLAAAPMSGPRPTLIKGADLMTMDPTLKEQLGTDVLIEGGKISAIGKDLAVEGAEVIDAKGMILMPGMIDGHRHVWQIIDNGHLVKTEPANYATYQAWKARIIVSLSPEDHYLGQYLGGLLAIDSGVTSVLDYAHGQINAENAVAAAKGLKDSGIGGWFAFQLGVSSKYKPGDTLTRAEAESQLVTPSTAAHWKSAERIQKEVFSDSSGILQFGLAPSAAAGYTVADVKKEWARARGMGVKMLTFHVGLPAKPHPEGYIGHRGSGIADLYDAGLLGPDYHADHANRLSAEELKMLRDTGGMVCSTCMGEFPYMASPIRGAPVHGRARAAGVAAGIGIDVNMTLTQDYFEHTRAAFWSLYLEPESVKIAQSYKSEDTLDFATALGAKAIRLGDVTGTIAVGKRADLVMLSTDRISFPMRGPLADRVLNFATQSDIDSVWVAGTARKRGGKMIGVDWAKLKADLIAAQARFTPLAESVILT